MDIIWSVSKSLEEKKKMKKLKTYFSQEEMLEALIEIVVGEYRFKNSLQKIISSIDDIHQKKKIQSQYGWLEKSILKAMSIANISIVDLTGEDYDPGMAVTPLNIEDFSLDDDLVVDKMIEPIILIDGNLKKTGTVMLGRKSK